jgi:hypothetical protein
LILSNRPKKAALEKETVKVPPKPVNGSVKKSNKKEINASVDQEFENEELIQQMKVGGWS